MKRTLYQPHLSEKSLTLAAHGWYTFAVDKYARKEKIAKSISDIYKVQVVDVRTIAVSGKQRRVGRMRRPMRSSNWKKALVRLAKGQHIDAFEVTAEGEKK